MTSSTPASPALSLDRTLSYRLHRLHKLSDLESQRRYEQEVGLSMSEGRCLTAIGTFEPMSVQHLARAANLNKGQASRAAQALVEQGLVRKEDDASDGRGVTLTLTPQGRTVWARAIAMVHQRNSEIFGCLSPADQAQLGRLLDLLIHHNAKS